ncbi:MAG: transposase [Methanolinea sp.]|nr:transposase [Methanolinea sp.]
MKAPIIVDLQDPKWLLLEKIMTMARSRVVKQAMERHEVKPIEKSGTIFRILFISNYFSIDLTDLLEELNKRSTLRSFAHVAQVPSASTIYQFLSRMREEQFVLMTSDILNSLCPRPSRRKFRRMIVDGSAITLDLNIFRRKFRKKDLLKKDYRWGFSNTVGYYLGYKLTLVIEYPSLLPLCMLLHPGSPHDSALFEEIMDELRRRRIIQNEDLLIFDKGYFSSKNYQLGVLKYKIIPLIFPRDNFKIEKAFSKMCYPLSVYSRHDGKKVKVGYERLVAILKHKLTRWTDFLDIHSSIEDFFKWVKNAFSLRQLHRYSRTSVLKCVCINVLLAGMIILSSFHSKKQLQALAEW